MEYGKFNRNRDDRDRGDRGGDRGDRGSSGGGRFERGGSGGGYGDRDRGRGGYNDRPRYGDRDRGGYNDRPRFNDRDRDRGGMERDNEESVYSQKVRAGKRRTYFFDVKKTRGEDFFITITESTRREDGYGYKRHKIFLYKEDFNRFVNSLNEVVDHVKTSLMPDFDYEEYDRRQAEWEAQNREQEDDDAGAEGPEERQGDDFDGEDDGRNRSKKGGEDEDEMGW